MKKRTLSTLAIALALAAGSTAFAHQSSDSGKATHAAKKEQKAWGIAGDAKAARRTIEIAMSDAMRFTPDMIRVKKGETVRFVIKNTGTQLHELVIGSKQELQEHAAMMVQFPNMEHDEPYMAHVAPGKTGELVWTFNRTGDFDFACLVAGHYAAGMVGKIKVAG